MSKPFLKWAGGKYTQLANLFVHIPAGKRLIEPFVGGGSVFLNSEKHADYLLADVNPDLINLYQMLAVVPDEVELKARWMFEHMRSPDGYELIRSEFNAQTLDATERAAAFLYLNRHCFNGLMRYNQANKFNVGWGGYKAPYYPLGEMKSFAAMAHIDNYNKALFDALTLTGVWEDDSQVKRMLVEWGNIVKKGKVEITIRRFRAAA